MSNRLARETSPYLLQHGENPVDWYPWGDEALSRARDADMPILLSIGYSACHWCHVMERESFEDPEVAALMNESFVCIKVDREERPDLDSIYMAAVQQMTGSGGWPMTVFLTPGLKPFFAGTYFPPEPRYGMASFRTVLESVAAAYRNRREDVERSAGQVADAIAAGVSGAAEGSDLLDVATLDAAAGRLKGQYDPVHGGFGGAPKFPQAMALDFVLRSWRRTGEKELLDLVENSLVAMAHGGIYDHLGGGFARYSTDATWLVPHFEKMLYDQALISAVYLHAFQATGRTGFRSGCTRTIDYVLRDLASPDGAFCSAEDADSEGEEGRFYTWSYDEARKVCGPNFEIAARTFGITPAGNWEGRTILHVAADRNTVPQDLQLTVEDYKERLNQAKGAMFEARCGRVRPARDDKVLCAWNGLMVASVAEAAAVLRRDDYLAAAQRAAGFLLDALVVDGRLMRSYRQGIAKVPGFLDDYAGLAGGLLQLYQADFNPRWYEVARGLVDDMIERFGDPEGGLFYSTGEASDDLLFRPRDFDDNAVPAGNSLAVEVLIQLSLLSGEDRYRQVAMSAVRPLHAALASHPLFFGRLLSAIDLHLGGAVEVAVVGDLGSPPAAELLEAVRGAYLPNKVVAGGAAGSTEPPLLRDRAEVGGQPAAYVCRGFVCRQPVTGAEELLALLSRSPSDEWASV